MTPEEQIEEFKARIPVDGFDFCEDLYLLATIRLMCHKYLYYICAESIQSDEGYDAEERDWFIMGRALGFLREDETSPCVGFNEEHPYAAAGKEMAQGFIDRGQLRKNQ